MKESIENSSMSVSVEGIIQASEIIQDLVRTTPVKRNAILSNRYNCNVYLKREDLQDVRSFKIRGAYHFLKNMSVEDRENGVVCASAGNHAQGVAYSCNDLKTKATIFMPSTTPRQKVSQVALFGGQYVDIRLVGDTFDDAYLAAVSYCNASGMTFVHPFDHPLIIEGQGTIGLEILQSMEVPVDYVFLAIGGGGLAAGVSTYIKHFSPETKVIGVEPAGAASMKNSLAVGDVLALDEIDKFVDGAAVKQVGHLTFDVCRNLLDDVISVPEGQVCTTILELYNENAIVAEPAGALAVAALGLYPSQLEGKNVVCIISGGNNDIDRMQEIKERSLIHEGLKHYFIVDFPQRSGALKEFVNDVLGPDDDITRFEYTKRNNREEGPALVGIELKDKEEYHSLIERMEARSIRYIEINKDPALFHLLI